MTDHELQVVKNRNLDGIYIHKKTNLYTRVCRRFFKKNSVLDKNGQSSEDSLDFCTQFPFCRKF